LEGRGPWGRGDFLGGVLRSEKQKAEGEEESGDGDRGEE
jgi:hypothetical protein